MKRKLDFVTNSSSVSYVGWGIYLSDEDLENEIFLKKCFENYKTYYEKEITYDDFKNISCKMEYIHGKGQENSILEINSNMGGQYFIIAHPNGMKDNQTLKEFKEEIIKEFEKLGFIIDNLNFIQESWTDN